MTTPGEGAVRPDILAGSATGSIYDLGYRRYDGPRLGRRHALWARCTSTACGSTFGIGRGGRAKIAPFGGWRRSERSCRRSCRVGVRAIAGPVVSGIGGTHAAGLPRVHPASSSSSS